MSRYWHCEIGLTQLRFQITFIGIPLAVLGVMPLLWNMVKAFVIHNRLSASLPSKARKYFSLTMDPASGTVSVSIGFFGLKFEDLVQSISSHQPYGDYINYKAPRLLGDSWMLLLDSNIYPKILEDKDTEPQRFLVYSDLQTQRVGCRCDWAVFVLLALALDVDPYEGGLMDIKRDHTNPFDLDLTTSSSVIVMTASKREKDIIAEIERGCSCISPIKAMAWISVMVVIDHPAINIIPLKLRFAEKNPLTGNNIRYHPAEDARLTNRPHQDLELTLIWIMYAESVYHTDNIPERDIIGNEGVLPVKQDMLKTQEEVLEELRAIDSLETRLSVIIPANPTLVGQTLAALSYRWQNPGVEIVGDLRKGREFLIGRHSGVEDPQGYVDIWRPLQNNVTFNALRDNYNPLPTLRSRSDANLTDHTSPMALLARVIIAISSIQKWPRHDWDVVRDHEGNIRSCEPRQDPIEELLPEDELAERIWLW